MPTISLRLSDEEHAELLEWARDGRRSLQKEIIWRLFTVEGGQAPKVWPAVSSPRVEVTGSSLDAVGVPANSPVGKIERPQVDASEHFKPDFKAERKKK